MFSVLMSVYHRDDLIHLDEAINSIYCQTIMPKQVVVVCDGPLPDSHYAILERWSHSFKSRIVDFELVKLPQNIGLGAALKAGAPFCTQDYIIRMDSDDLSVKNRLELTKIAINEHPNASVIGGQIEEFHTTVGDLGRKRLVPNNHGDIVKFGKRRNPMNHVTVCIRKDCLTRVGSYESVIYHEDYYLWVKFIASNLTLHNISNVLVNVRTGNDLIGRRLGTQYFNYERNFARKCVDIGYMNRFDKVKYLGPRLLFRTMPKSLLNKVYGRLRE
ncbi:glycosyltransferase [Vibrio genomosp. F6]|uniref:Glycosyltransferase 2-like domain-containing protein n=1 Tax=Vibrio genomosp. F6 str. FF-238 TaxID=1191298 RepID=A0A1E5D2G3_9VIBR|nr:glycosyltransferase [Vibrio genomosp. F6]OEE77707.1 hypothetical protein A130_14345 [Vibrio genomosp. F6 str. FF-238]